MWIAGVAFVVGVAKVVVFSTQVYQAIQASPGPALGQSAGFVGFFLAFLTSERLIDLMSASNLLVGGVTVMTVIVAWADRRRGWLIALIVVTVLTLLWPIGFQSLIFARLPTTPPPLSATATLFVQGGTASLYAVPLIPVLMAFTFALARRKDASAPSRQNIAIQPM
jgi:hypothetical protein